MILFPLYYLLGSFDPITDILQAECSKTSNRGLLICIEGGVIAFGSCMAYWIDYGSSFGPPDLVWRFPIAFQIVFALIVAIPMIFLPVSYCNSFIIEHMLKLIRNHLVGF